MLTLFYSFFAAIFMLPLRAHTALRLLCGIGSKLRLGYFEMR